MCGLKDEARHRNHMAKGVPLRARGDEMLIMIKLQYLIFITDSASLSVHAFTGKGFENIVKCALAALLAVIFCLYSSKLKRIAGLSIFS